MRKWLAMLTAMLAATTVGLVVPAAATSQPYCGIRWGSLPEAHNEMSQAPLVNVRAGRHQCFDRLVLDLRGNVRRHALAVSAELFCSALEQRAQEELNVGKNHEIGRIVLVQLRGIDIHLDELRVGGFG